MPLPFLKTKEASISVTPEAVKRKPDNEEKEYDYLDSASDDLIAAIQSRDTKGVTAALRAAFELMEQSPHEEYPMEGAQ